MAREEIVVSEGKKPSRTREILCEEFGLERGSGLEEIAYAICGNEKNYRRFITIWASKVMILDDELLVRIGEMVGKGIEGVGDLKMIADSLRSISQSIISMHGMIFEVLGQKGSAAMLAARTKENLSPAERYLERMKKLSEDEEFMNTKVVKDYEFDVEGEVEYTEKMLRGELMKETEELDNRKDMTDSD